MIASYPLFDSQVAEKKCWSCGQTFSCDDDLRSHLHAVESYLVDGKVPWEGDVYLKPFLEDDSLLHSLSIDDDDEEDEDGHGVPMGRGQQRSAGNGVLAEPPPRGNSELSTVSEGNGPAVSALFEKECAIGSTRGEGTESLAHGTNDSQLKVARASVNAKAIRAVDDSYFGSYSSFGIHREMLGDKVG